MCTLHYSFFKKVGSQALSFLFHSYGLVVDCFLGEKTIFFKKGFMSLIQGLAAHFLSEPTQFIFKNISHIIVLKWWR